MKTDALQTQAPMTRHFSMSYSCRKRCFRQMSTSVFAELSHLLQ